MSDAADPPGRGVAQRLQARAGELLRDGGWSLDGCAELAELARALATELDGALLELGQQGGGAAQAATHARRLHEAGRALGDLALAQLEAGERVRAASGRLADAGPVSEIVDRATVEAAAAAALDRVVLSRVVDGWLVAEGIHCRDAAGEGAALMAALRQQPVRLEYPLVEAELLRRRRPQLIAADGGASTVRRAFADTIGWHGCVIAPVVLEGRVIGFLHGDRRPQGAALRALDRDALQRFADAFAGLFERAVLLRRLRVQRQELRQVASWADARTSELSDGAIDLTTDRDGPPVEQRVLAGAAGSPLRDLLTRRELDVVERMVKGETNAEIARALVVSEGTVKFHVKNILRKLGASNRAEAASRYLRLALRGGDGGATRGV